MFATVSVEPYDDRIPASIAAQAFDPLANEVSAKLADRPMIERTDTAKEESQWKVVAGVLAYEERIYVSAVDSLRGQVISLFHDNPESGHFGALKPTELVCRDFYWRVMDSCVSKYVNGCEVCHRIKAPRHPRQGINMPLEAPLQPWEDITMDFITDLPE
jgi:hypothetical protein